RVAALEHHLRLDRPLTLKCRRRTTERRKVTGLSKGCPVFVVRAMGRQIVQLSVSTDRECIPSLRRILDWLEIATIEVRLLVGITTVARRNHKESMGLGTNIVKVAQFALGGRKLTTCRQCIDGCGPRRRGPGRGVALCGDRH